MRPAVFLDRDGVLNHLISRDNRMLSPQRFADFRVVIDAPLLVGRLQEAGFLCLVVTNQPDIARQKMLSSELDKMTRELFEFVGVDDVFICPHDIDECDCRKPLPGLLIQASNRYGLDFSKSWMIGDRISDIEAGNAVGVKGILIKSEQTTGLDELGTSRNFDIVDDFFQAVNLILS